MTGPVRQPPKLPRPTPVPRVLGPFGPGSPFPVSTPEEAAAFWRGPGAVQPLLADHGDGTCTVTFCWREPPAGDGPPVQQVLLFANRLTDETDLGATMLDRVPGTDLWHASFRMADDWRASYAFLVRVVGEPAPWQGGDQVRIRQVLDRGLVDPRNPQGCRNRAGVLQSVVSLPGAPTQPWQDRTDVPRGALTEHRVRGHSGAVHRVWVHDPPGTTPDEPLPLLVVLDGEVWTTPGHDATALVDAMVHDAVVGPLRLLLPDSGGRDARWARMGARGDAVRDLADDLVPWMRSVRGVVPGADAVAVAGQSLGGLTALRAALSRPDVVGAALSQSASLWQDDLLALTASAAGHGARPLVHLAHGSQEWVLAGPHAALADALGAAGFPTEVAVHNGGHDYAWWRGALPEALAWWGRQRDPAVGDRP